MTIFGDCEKGKITLVDELSRDQITWLNNYHAHVYEMLSPRLTEDEKVWLKNKCAPIGR